jgi:hypothetical protein
MLVLIGATPEGRKEFVGFQTGVRESAQSWREFLIDIKQRGLAIAPDLAIGYGALGRCSARSSPEGTSARSSIPHPTYMQDRGTELDLVPAQVAGQYRKATGIKTPARRPSARPHVNPSGPAA